MITIEKPKQEDFDQIHQVHETTWLETYPNKELNITEEDIKQKLGDRSVEDKNKKLKAILDNPSSVFLVAKDGKQVIGFCHVLKKESLNQLKSIYILKKYQGQGIGYTLWNKAKEFLDDSKPIIVHLATYNDKAINFYKKIGFIDTGKRFTEERFRMSVDGSLIPEMEMELAVNK